MSNFVSELEQNFSNQGNQEGGQQGGFGGNDNQQQGNSGGNDNQQRDNQQEGGQQQSSGGGGFMKGLENTGKDAMLDQQVNQFMTKEGVPQGADGFIDNAVNQEFNKFS